MSRGLDTPHPCTVRTDIVSILDWCFPSSVPSVSLERNVAFLCGGPLDCLSPSCCFAGIFGNLKEEEQMVGILSGAEFMWGEDWQGGRLELILGHYIK